MTAETLADWVCVVALALAFGGLIWGAMAWGDVAEWHDDDAADWYDARPDEHWRHRR